MTIKEIQSQLNLLTALETLDNIKIRDALIACRKENDTLVFTNQVGESFEFNLQNLDVDLLKSTIINSANNFTSNSINQLANNLHENLNLHADSLKIVDSKLQKRIDADSKDIRSTIKKVYDTLLDKVNKNLLSIEDVKKIIELLISKEEVKNLISAAKSAITSKVESKLNANVESLNATLSEIVNNLDNLDYLEDVIVEGDEIFKIKNGKKVKLRINFVRNYYGGGGGGFEEFEYTNPVPTSVRVGGIPKGTTFYKAKSQTLWNMLLHGVDDPYFSTFNINYNSEYEVGYTIQAESKTAYWSINDTKLLQANSIKITYVNGGVVVAENLANTGSATFVSPIISFAIPSQVDFKISAMSVTNNELSDKFSFYFKHRIYVGQSDQEILTQGQVKLLELTDLVDKVEGTYPINEGGYKWICYPKYFGLKKGFKDFASDIDVEMEDPIVLMITNAYGLNIEYYCHRSFYKLGSAMEIVVS